MTAALDRLLEAVEDRDWEAVSEALDDVAPTVDTLTTRVALARGRRAP